MSSMKINGVTYYYDNKESAYAASMHAFDSKGSKIALGIGMVALLASAVVWTREIVIGVKDAREMKRIRNNTINKNNKESKSKK